MDSGPETIMAAMPKNLPRAESDCVLIQTKNRSFSPKSWLVVLVIMTAVAVFLIVVSIVMYVNVLNERCQRLDGQEHPKARCHQYHGHDVQETVASGKTNSAQYYQQDSTQVTVNEKSRCQDEQQEVKSSTEVIISKEVDKLQTVVAALEKKVTEQQPQTTDTDPNPGYDMKFLKSVFPIKT